MSTHPCAEVTGSCPAVVENEGEYCPIHAKANQGPYSTPCERCGKKIEKKHLWVRARRRDNRADTTEYPWHWPECVPGRPIPFKPVKVKKSWDKGLGLLEDRR